jgi:hypothetical protein
MKRTVQTSTGYVQIDYSGKGWGTVEVFDEDGWQLEDRIWGMQGYPADAPEVLANCTSLSSAKIDRITAETGKQFEARGGVSAAREQGRIPILGRALFAGVALIAVAAIGGLVLLIAALTSRSAFACGHATTRHETFGATASRGRSAEREFSLPTSWLSRYRRHRSLL